MTTDHKFVFDQKALQKALAATHEQILLDATIPGATVSVDPITAEEMGAFEETALDLEEAHLAMQGYIDLEDSNG